LKLHHIRLKGAWLLVLPFLVLSRPTWLALGIGGVVSAVGLLLRGWAAGTIRKDEELTTSGPYAHTRNPLYLGSFFIGIGVTVAGGHWIWPLMFLLFFAVVYGRTMSGEAGWLADSFGQQFREYAVSVPAGRGTWESQPSAVIVTVRGPSNRVVQLTRDSVRVVATPSESDPDALVPLEVITPPGITGRASPERTLVRRRNRG